MVNSFSYEIHPLSTPVGTAPSKDSDLACTTTMMSSFYFHTAMCSPQPPSLWAAGRCQERKMFVSCVGFHSTSSRNSLCLEDRQVRLNLNSSCSVGRFLSSLWAQRWAVGCLLSAAPPSNPTSERWAARCFTVLWDENQQPHREQGHALGLKWESWPESDK